MSSPVDEAMSRFLSAVESKQKKEEKRATRIDRTIHEKHLKLIPVRQLLKRFMEMDLIVHNTEMFTRSTFVAKKPLPQKFQVYENNSSPSWEPGVSLFFDHPARVEIAIPNDPVTGGVIVIRCSTYHPDSGLFSVKFNSVEEACFALSDFLAKNTVRASPIQKDPEF